MEQHIRLAQALPPRLLQLFKRFPPPQVAAVAPLSSTSALPSSQEQPEPIEIQIAENTSSSDPNASSTTPSPASPTRKTNPFMPWKNPRTGNWHSPHYSLRRQKELFRLAVEHNVLPLMPLSPKHPEVREQKRIERGLRVQGTGVGKKVKGHQWERTLRNRLEDRRKAMEGMPELVEKWKRAGHGRTWKKWPK